MKFLNVIVENEHLWQHDEDLLFGNPAYRRAAQCNILRMKPEEADMYDLLVQVGAYPTKILAEQCWHETGAKIPEGYSDFFTVNGKRLVIWNPTV